jgi:serine/threonine-protein kinase HipA
MKLTQVKQLEVWRTFGDGSRCKVGVLAQNSQGVFFQYQQEYLAQFSNLSPFKLNYDASLQVAPKTPHHGLHGVFADSLPDGWGLLLMDKVFRQAGIPASQITAMDRLAFVGNRGMGALSYQPVSALQSADSETQLSVSELGMQAQALFEGQTTEVLTALVEVGSSGGARPKAQVYLQNNRSDYCSTRPQPGSKAYLLKFTSSQLPLGNEEGLCEAVYLCLAKQAGIDVANWQLLEAPAKSGAKKWLAVERFDIIQGHNEAEGRVHLHSACGLLDADFRMPSLDYEDLIKASSLICKSPAAGQAQFRRAVFNLFALNQDDHSKNWAFLQGDKDQWQLAPFYDVTFSPSPYNEHATAFAGFGKTPSLKAMQALANQANFAHWKQAQIVIEQVLNALSSFAQVAKQLEVSAETIQLITRQLDGVYQQNKVLLEG